MSGPNAPKGGIISPPAKPSPPQPPQPGAIAQPAKPLTPGDCEPFLTPRSKSDYLTYIASVTTGRVTPMINGRDSAGPLPDKIVADPFHAMQAAVEATKAGDDIYLAAWMFGPAVLLTAPTPLGVKTWGELLRNRAIAGVRVRILMAEFPSKAPVINKPVSFFSEIRGYIAELDKLIDSMPAAKRPFLQYLVSKHPVAIFGTQVGSHHQKFMIVNRGGTATAFCGGLDICRLRTPESWTAATGWAAWHDIHLKLEGMITRDLEYEFVFRWNREKSRTDIPPRKDWGGLAILRELPASKADQQADRNGQRMQMHRTVSVNGSLPPPFGPEDTKRDDIWQAYLKIIKCTSQLLYMENQYFRQVKLADVIVKRAQEAPSLKVIIVVPEALDEGSDALTEHGNSMQFDFFKRLHQGLGPARLRVYSMRRRFIHSKLIIGDDRFMSVGSCNANPRGFRVDSELNVTLSDSKAVGPFRRRLWSHDLSVPEKDIAKWKDSEMFAKWDAIAASNEKLLKGKPDLWAALATTAGECVVPFDYRKIPGSSSLVIPNSLAGKDPDGESDEPVV